MQKQTVQTAALKKSKGHGKRAFAIFAALLIMLTMLLAVPVDAQAATKKLVKPTKIVTTLGTKTLTVDAGKTQKAVGLKFTPTKNVNKDVTYKSSNIKVVKVSTTGVLTPVKQGKATITVTSKANKKVKATYKVSVRPAPTKVTIKSPKSYTLAIGQTAPINTTVTPKASTNALTYSLNKKGVATVSSKGVIKGVAKGSRTITAQTYNKKKANVSVKVVEGPAKKAKLTGFKKAPANNLLYVGSSYTLDKPYLSVFSHIEYRGLNAKGEPVTNWSRTKPKTGILSTSKSVDESRIHKETVYSKAIHATKWSSSNPNVLAVNQNGKITAKKVTKAESATISATFYNGAKASVKITVRPLPTSISVTPRSDTLVMSQKTTTQLKANYSPAASSTYGKVSWKSSNTKVATVSNTGLVTAVAAGSATITASLKVGDKTYTSTSTITVEDYMAAYNNATAAFERSTVSYTEEATLKMANFQLSSGLNTLLGAIEQVTQADSGMGSISGELQDAVNMEDYNKQVISRKAPFEESDLKKASLNASHLKANGASKSGNVYTFRIKDENKSTGYNALSAFTANPFGEKELRAMMGFDTITDPQMKSFMDSFISGFNVSTKDIVLEAEILPNGQFKRVTQYISVNLSLSLSQKTIELLIDDSFDKTMAAAIKAIMYIPFRIAGGKLDIFTADATLKLDFTEFTYH
ncbi:MAG: Ig-like domain-containing protein [Oscillospiraceae bacterium]|nr:Ig-like domain-containing protein [Oscillospiraceae bacterium]